jgi:hypothetical protein
MAPSPALRTTDAAGNWHWRTINMLVFHTYAPCRVPRVSPIENGGWGTQHSILLSPVPWHCQKTQCILDRSHFCRHEESSNYLSFSTSPSVITRMLNGGEIHRWIALQHGGTMTYCMYRYRSNRMGHPDDSSDIDSQWWVMPFVYYSPHGIWAGSNNMSFLLSCRRAPPDLTDTWSSTPSERHLRWTVRTYSIIYECWSTAIPLSLHAGGRMSNSFTTPRTCTFQIYVPSRRYNSTSTLLTRDQIWSSQDSRLR